VIPKLFIYDTGDKDNKDQAEGRFSGSDRVVPVPVASEEQLLDALDRLVSANAVFDRVLVQTHGEPGELKFSENHVGELSLNLHFTNRQYHTLFPFYTRFYFDGCNVGKGTDGTDFLDAAGAIFLYLMGGEMIAWESYGYGFDSWIPFIGGHTIHFSGGLKRLRYAPGGVRLPDPPPIDPLRDTGKVWVGNKV
jgi:hypothetical protein